MKNPLLAGSLKKNNKGSALVSVIVSMLFIMALGAALLFSSYMAYKIALAQRQGTEVFYTAESMADDIRFGLQTEATRALARAYTETMTEYSKTGDPLFDPQKSFAAAFKRELLESTAGAGGESLRVFSTDGGEMIGYSPAALSAYVKAPESGAFSVTSGGVENPDTYPGEVLMIYDGEGRLSELRLSKVSLKYTEDGYESRITTDLVISTPDFYAKPIISEGLSGYAIVAEDGIEKDGGGESTVSGKVYAGELNVIGAGNSLKLKEGSLTMPGALTVSDGAAFDFDSPENELWAKELAADKAGSLRISGRAYVADDLMLGKDGSAQLSGSYFGFGSSFSSPGRSSAVIANGKGASLDISGLDRLSLAGVSFIDVFGAGLYTDAGEGSFPAVPMGESLSVKSSQLAYLVPAECIQNYSSNPFVFNGSEVFAPAVDMNAAVWTIDGGEKSLNDYLGGGKGQVKTLYKNLDGGETKLAYVFLLFSAQEHANKYFRDYFEVYPDRISEYLKFYLELSDKGDNADILSAGNAFYMDGRGSVPEGEEVLTLVPASTSRWSESLQKRFDALSSPLSGFADMEKLHGLPPGEKLEFYKDGKLSALVVNGDYSHSASIGDSLRLILASGDLSVSGSFTGIVLTEGSVRVRGSIKGLALSVDILDASCTVGEETYYLADFIGSGLIMGPQPGEENPWAPGRLVRYENWTKN